MVGVLWQRGPQISSAWPYSQITCLALNEPKCLASCPWDSRLISSPSSCLTWPAHSIIILAPTQTWSPYSNFAPLKKYQWSYNLNLVIVHWKKIGLFVCLFHAELFNCLLIRFDMHLCPLKYKVIRSLIFTSHAWSNTLFPQGKIIGACFVMVPERKHSNWQSFKLHIVCNFLLNLFWSNRWIVPSLLGLCLYPKDKPQATKVLDCLKAGMCVKFLPYSVPIMISFTLPLDMAWSLNFYFNKSDTCERYFIQKLPAILTSNNSQFSNLNFQSNPPEKANSVQLACLFAGTWVPRNCSIIHKNEAQCKVGF